MRIYRTSWLLPVVSPPIREAAVAVEDGRIVAAGPWDDVLEAAGRGAEIHDLGPAAVLPGLVNAHVHVELSWMARDRPPGGEFVAWVRGLLERRKDEDAEAARAAAERAIDDMVRRGTVAVGDVANGLWVAPMLARSPLHAVVFHEIYGFRTDDAERLLREAIERVASVGRDADVLAAARRVRVVLAPHAPHTTSAPLLRALASRSAASGDLLSIHVAESEAETALLRDGAGPFAELLHERGMWDDAWTPPGHSSVEHLDRLGALSPRTLAVHCVHLAPGDVSRLQLRNVTVVTCPRSNRRLGVGRSSVPQLLSQGIRVALGTDSVASVEDLDLFAEMAALREEHPQLRPATVVRMATLDGAAALGLADRLGTIERGKLARLVVVPLASARDDPFEAVCSVPPHVIPLEAPAVEVRGT